MGCREGFTEEGTVSSLDVRSLHSVTAGTLLAPRTVPAHSKHSVNMYNVRMDGWMNGFKWFQGFLGFCGGEMLELSIPGRRAWSRIQEGNGTPALRALCRAHPPILWDVVETHISVSHWASLQPKGASLPRTPRPRGSR